MEEFLDVTDISNIESSKDNNNNDDDQGKDHSYYLNDAESSISTIVYKWRAIPNTIYIYRIQIFSFGTLGVAIKFYKLAFVCNPHSETYFA